MNRILILPVLCMVCGCSSKKPDTSTVEVSILHDQTDPMALTPDYALVKRIYDFNEHPDRAAIFRATVITDKRLNPSFQVQLPNGAYTEEHNEADDINYRKRCIKAFCGQVDSITKTLLAVDNRSASLGNSECFSVFAKELTKLSTSKAQKRVLLTYSDLAENSGMYQYAFKPLQLRDTASIKARLLQMASLPNNLSGIQVYLLYRPNSRKEDQRFFILSTVYRTLLEERRAQVIIAASNDINIE